jgi:hypothetical protein
MHFSKLAAGIKLGSQLVDVLDAGQKLTPLAINQMNIVAFARPLRQPR